MLEYDCRLLCLRMSAPGLIISGLGNGCRRATFSASRRPKRPTPLYAAKRELGSRFLKLTPLTREPSQGSHALPTCAGRGRRLGMGRKPRVPLALHPGLLIFRPYRGLDKTLSRSGSWLLTFCCSQPCSSLRSQGYQGPEPLVRPLCATLREFCSRFGSHGQQLLLTVGLSSRTAHDYRKRRVNRGYRSRRYQRPEPLVSRPSFAFLFNSKLPHSKYLAKLNGYLQRPRWQEFVPAASQELQCPAPSRSR